METSTWSIIQQCLQTTLRNFCTIWSNGSVPAQDSPAHYAGWRPGTMVLKYPIPRCVNLKLYSLLLSLEFFQKWISLVVLFQFILQADAGEWFHWSIVQERRAPVSFSICWNSAWFGPCGVLRLSDRQIGWWIWRPKLTEIRKQLADVSLFRRSSGKKNSPSADAVGHLENCLLSEILYFWFVIPFTPKFFSCI